VPTIDPTAAPPPLADWLRDVRTEVDADLARRLAGPPGLAAADPAARLWEAFRYAALGPGKRLRPGVVIAACEAVGGDRGAAMPAAAAIELVHAYTLVHDDLPAMDDDDERRGRPTTHRKFDEATAILAGDGLLTLGFGALGDLGPRAADAVRVLARRAGAELLAGQARDLAAASSDRPLNLGELEAIHLGKTGALFGAAAELGAIAAGAGARERAALADYGVAIGVAFQHADDRDDHEHPEVAAAAARRIAELCADAGDIVARLGARAGRLAEIASWISRAA
jgi:geranylgeranyl pyrophosphate synthase